MHVLEIQICTKDVKQHVIAFILCMCMFSPMLCHALVQPFSIRVPWNAKVSPGVVSGSLSNEQFSAFQMSGH